VKRAIQAVLDLPDLPLVNVNLPPRPAGLSWTSQSFRHYDGKMVPGTDPMGRHHFWYTVVPIETVEEGTDRWAMIARWFR